MVIIIPTIPVSKDNANEAKSQNDYKYEIKIKTGTKEIN